MSANTTLELIGNIKMPQEFVVGLQVSILTKFVIEKACVADIQTYANEQAALYHHLRLKKVGEPELLNPINATYTQGVYSESLEQLQADLQDVIGSKHGIQWRHTIPYDNHAQRVILTDTQLGWVVSQDSFTVEELQLDEYSTSPQGSRVNSTKIPFSGGR